MIIIWLTVCCRKLNDELTDDEQTNDEQTENNEELNYNENQLNYFNNLGLRNLQSLVWIRLKNYTVERAKESMAYGLWLWTIGL